MSSPDPRSASLARPGSFLAHSRGAGRAAAAGPLLRGGAAISEHHLRNGLQVLVAERRGDPVVATLLFYRAGSRTESEREAGISHFLEHMMFKGTRRYGKGEIDRITTVLGGQNNAFTGNDHTAYWFEFASDRWQAALELEADRMRKLVLDPEEFEAERAVVLEELAMGEDDPWRSIGQRVEATVFGRHPYGRPIIGFPDSLAGLQVEDLRHYHGRFYHPGNATLVIGGDVSRSTALKAAREHFGPIPAGRPFEEVDCYRSAMREPVGEQRLRMGWSDPCRRMCMAWPTTRVGTDDDYALDIASAVLTSGRLARLQDRLVHREALATTISSNNDVRVEGGAFWLFGECAQGVNPEDLEAAVDEELERLASEKLPAAELRRARSILAAAEAYDSETVSDIAEELGEFAVDADWTLALDGGERHARVTTAALRDCAARYLRPERRVIGWCVPREELRRGAASGSRSR